MLRNLIELNDGIQIRSGSDAKYAIQSCTITESVNNGTELMLGSACCSCLEATILDTVGDLSLSAGQEVALYKENDAGSKIRVGTFRLEAPTRKSENVYKITAYDRVADLDKDLSDWLKGLDGWPYDLAAFAGMVCEACGLTLVTTDIPNGSFPVQKFHKAGVTGRRLMEWICEIACRFCRANADGDIELGWYTSSGVTIRPTGDRYYFAGALAYEDYKVAAIDAVKLRLADSDSGALWPQVVMGTLTGNDYLNIRSGAGTNYAKVGELAQGDEVEILEQTTLSDGTVWGRIEEGWICITGYMTLETIAAENPYIITGNPILLAKVSVELLPCLEVIQSQLATLPEYKPCKVSLPAGLDIRAGHTVQIVDKHGNQFTTCVMTKTQTGQRDTLECTGSARRDSSTAANNQTAAQVAQQAVDNQTQKELFNKLTNGGQAQGLFMGDDGQVYLNVSYAVAGLLSADHIDVDNLVARRLKTESDSCSLEVGDGEMRMWSGDEDLMAIFYDGTPWMVLRNSASTHFFMNNPMGVFVGVGGALMSKALARLFVEYISGVPVGIAEADIVKTDAIETRAGLTTPKLFGKMVQWVPNDDKTYILVGVDEQ